MEFPKGVIIRPLKPKVDKRGYFMESFRKEWTDRIGAKQWNIVRSKKGVLRGMRLHKRHTDYVILFEGIAVYALLDLRSGSPTEDLLVMIKLRGSKPKSVIIPPGVAHGFYFFEDSYYVYSVTHYYDKEDEFGFHFADPQANIPWPNKNPIMTRRDKNLPSMKMVKKQVPSWRKLQGSK